LRPTAPATALAYQGFTGEPSKVLPGYDDPADHDDQIDAVAAKVLSAFRQSATDEQMADLQRSKPSVPRDLDPASTSRRRHSSSQRAGASAHRSR
jgi:hypothetical protein